MRRGGEEMLDDLDLAWEEQESGRQRRPGAPSRQVRQGRRKEKKRRRRSFGALFISVLLLATLGGGVYWGVGKVQEFFGAPDYTSNPATVEVSVTVDPGDSTSVIGSKLYDKKVVKSAKAFVKAASADPKGNTIQPGSYKLFEEMPASLALAVLLDPAKNMVVNRVTIPEGMVTVDIYDKLSKATGIPVADFVEAGKDPVALGIDASWFAPREDGRTVIKSVEGFLYPETYAFQPGLTAQEILTKMVGQFISVATDLKFAETVQATLHISPYEALIAASIAQAEAVDPVDFAKVAKVLYNRAYTGKFPCSCLGLDSAVNYWLKIQGHAVTASEHLTQAQLHDAANPYNTHDKPGMPGGAISNPGKEALQGAMAPVGAANVFYFMTIDTKGTMGYATTAAQHQANITLACKNGIPLC
jgi:UPF0755 protein